MKELIVILGAGESGTGAALLAQDRGFDVFVSDFGMIGEDFKTELSDSKIAFEEGNHTEDKILEASIIIKSPGIPESAPIMRLIRNREITVISEIEFASRYTNAQFVAITGTNGKTTTTLLTYHILKNNGINVGLAGNIGQSLSGQVMADGPDGRDYYVIELSSFQLDDMYDFKAHVAILLNITPDHLDRYQNDFEKYRDSKFRILRNMTETDSFIYWNSDSVITENLAKTQIGVQKLRISSNDASAEACIQGERLNILGEMVPVADLPLKGNHNYLNIMAASLAAISIGLTVDNVFNSLETYRNAPHRMEEVGQIDGITFINDSKATNVDSVYYALDAYDTTITWIAGGVDKGNNYSKIKSLVAEKVRTMICLGQDNQRLREEFDDVLSDILETRDIKEAAKMAYEYSRKNDVVLLSPACASFDLFKNYEDRGDQFRNAVKELEDELNAKTI